MKLSQQNLVSTHEHIRSLVEQWINGLITDFELTGALARVSEAFDARKPELLGLIDPNTGLQYGNGAQIE